jgi:hypothetical protein
MASSQSWPGSDQHGQFTALACAMMIERMNYLRSVA